MSRCPVRSWNSRRQRVRLSRNTPAPSTSRHSQADRKRNVHTESRPVSMGIVVDGVAEVLTLTDADIEDTPEFGAGTATPYLLGMAKVKGKVKILLEIDHVLMGHDTSGLDALMKAVER